MFVLKHTSITAIDHLCEPLKTENYGEGNIFSNLELHHSKCECLIRNAIAPSILQDIIKNIGQRRYSIILDESTDVSVNKYLAICVRYFDGTKIITDCLGLIEIEHATAEDLC
jgi:hypothetical protein